MTAGSSPPLPLTCVDNEVLGQIADVDESFAADAALVRADVVVVADVIGQLAGLDESAREGHQIFKQRSP